jgi:hypothetical protein
MLDSLVVLALSRPAALVAVTSPATWLGQRSSAIMVPATHTTAPKSSELRPMKPLSSMSAEVTADI